MFKILLDAGHGAGRAHNRGATCYNEGDNNYYYSLVLKKELEKIKGVKVDLTRNKISDNPSLASRAAKGAGYDLFMSLHSNGAIASVRGTEIYDSVARPNKALADKLVKAIANEFGHRNRGTKYRKGSSGSDYYGVLRGNKAKSSMIIEHGFHSNSIDCQYFKNNHQGIAQTTANVIRDHYSLSGTPSRKPTTSRPKSNLIRRGDRGSNVKQLQSDLIKSGYSVKYGADGIFGAGTESAVRQLQADYKISVDGIVGNDTRAKLKLAQNKKAPNTSVKTWRNYISGKIVRDLQQELNRQFNKGLAVDGYFGDNTINALVNVRQGARGNLTRIIQERLNAKGYKLSRDGIFGAGTESAVRQFQSKNGLSADGVVGKNTWTKLYSK